MKRFADIDHTKLQALVDAETAQAQSEVWGDGDLTARIDDDGYPTNNPRGTLCDHRAREVVCYFATAAGTWQPTRLKRGDHVLVLGVLRVVVAMPARNRQRFLAYAPDVFGDDALRPIEWSAVTDRAPADPTESPMPLDIVDDQAPNLDPEEDPIAVLELSAQKMKIKKVGDP